MKHLIEKLFKWMGNEVVEMEEKVLEDQNKIENGQGTQTLPNGWKYVGSWKDGKEWNGTIYRKNGNNFGKVVNGKVIKQ